MQPLIVDFMKNFYGYGNLNGSYWFVGMEEGCGPDWNLDARPRFERWQARGRRQTEDLRGFHFDIGIRKHWEATNGKPVKIQFTWRRLIETILAVEGEVATDEKIARYQAQYLGTPDGETCLLELLPLPSRRVSEFGYEHLANEAYPFFCKRAAYRKHVLGARIAHLQCLIAQYKPRHVVFYGKSYRKAWEMLVRNTPWVTVDGWIRRCQFSGAQVWLTPHPAAHKIPRNLFTSLGEKIREGDPPSANPICRVQA
jgi:hypothetical protein